MPQPGDILLNQRVNAIKKVLITLPRDIGDTAVLFTKERFKQQNWKNKSAVAWQKRKGTAKRNKGRSLLMDTGRLKRSIRRKRTTSNSVTIGSNVPYAKAHNEGVNKKVTVGARTRNMNLPKRQFMGKSHALDKRIKAEINRQITKAIK